MPISHTFNNKIILMQFAGKYSPDEMKERIISALDDNNCPDDAVMLMDMSKDESVQDRTPEEIREMSYFFGQIRERINFRLCMVVSDLLAFGLMNMAKAYDQSLGINCNAFTEMDKAVAWLNSSEDNRLKTD